MNAVLLSGGLDSSTLLAYVLASTDEDVIAISFNYGQKHSKELESARGIAALYEIDHHVIDLRTSFDLIRTYSGSTLLDGGDVPEGHYADETMKKTIVPNRNMIMLSMAAGLLEARLGPDGVGALYIANHAGDHTIYPDCRPEFIDAVAKTIMAATEGRIEVEAPFTKWTKADIAQRAYLLDLPIEKTWSCYKGGTLHCGKCGTCYERIEAMRIARIPDPTEYEVESILF